MTSMKMTDDWLESARQYIVNYECDCDCFLCAAGECCTYCVEMEKEQSKESYECSEYKNRKEIEVK